MATEKRYYLVDCMNYGPSMDDILEFSDEDFIAEAELEGNVYSEAGFLEAFNACNISSETQFLRIIDVQI